MEFSISVQSKLPGTKTTIFSVMSEMAHQHDAINLSQGFPNYSSAPLLFELVKKYMDEGMNQYAPLRGESALLEAISDKIYKTYKTTISQTEEICVTSGATQAVFTAIQALVHPGDEVIVFDPAFDIYDPGIQLSGGKAVHVALKYPAFEIDWDYVESLVNEKTKCIIINFPHNPTGTRARKEDMLSLQRLVIEHQLYVISDEVYEHMIYDGERHESVLLYPALYQRSIVAFSFGKTFHNTGWKVGYAVGPPTIMKEFCKVHQFVVFSVNKPVQLGLSAFMKDPEVYLSLPDFYQKKRDYFLQLMGGSNFTFKPSHGTYFQLMDYSAISDKNDLEFSKELIVEHGVAGIPTSPFYRKSIDNHLIRFCFAKTNNILEKAAEKLCRI
jgi:methionine aminotransferase